MKKLILIFLILSFFVQCIFYSGCAAIFSGTKDEISLSSEPTGATIYINGVNRGKTPITLSLKKGKEYTIEFEKQGYEKHVFHLSYSLGAGWLILDILAGLIGIIIDAATGAWYGFDEDAYKARLEKKE